MMIQAKHFPLVSVLAVFCTVSICGGATTDTKSSTADKPNILVYIADDMSWAHTGVEGDKAVKTPNIDRVAKSGVRFRHAFASSPSCTPSRGALLTGQAFCRLEEGSNLLSTLPPKFPVYPELLEKAGYRIGHASKVWGPGDYRAGGRTTHPGGHPYKNFAAFLKDQPQGKPFCFIMGSTDPHRPYDAGSGVKSGIDLAAVSVPPTIPDTPEMRSDVADYLAEVQRFDSGLGALLNNLDAAGLTTNTLIVVTSDNGMPYPRSKCNLYDWGTHLPLVAAWPGKIAPGRVVDDFVDLTDLAPAFLQAAGVTVPPEMTGRSILPLLLAKGSGQIDKDRDAAFFGRERHDVFRLENGQPVGYPKRGIRTAQFLYIRNFKPDRIPSGDHPTIHQDNDRGPAKAYVVQNKDNPAVKPFYDRAYGKRPAEELYDLEKDPAQHNNVAGQEAYGDTLKKLRAQLDRRMTALKDPRRPGGTDPDVFDRYPVYRAPKQ